MVTKEEIAKGNSIISEFMGYKMIPAWSTYHKHWQKLMPVVEKISRRKVGDGIEYVEYSYPHTFGMLNAETGQIMVRLNGCQCFQADTLIEATWLAVVDFCKYQNEKKK